MTCPDPLRRPAAPEPIEMIYAGPEFEGIHTLHTLGAGIVAQKHVEKRETATRTTSCMHNTDGMR
jgi:hypothetical protein